MEAKVTSLIENSAMAASEGNFQIALEKAKEAGKRERLLTKHREQLIASSNSNSPIPPPSPNLDLTYCVLLNLASAYHNCKMYQEALNSYSVIAKNKLFNQSGRLRVNMGKNINFNMFLNDNIGNIYYEMGKFEQAIKMYRMALDQIPNTNRDIR